MGTVVYFCRFEFREFTWPRNTDGWELAVRRFLEEIGLSLKWADLLEYKESTGEAMEFCYPIEREYPARDYSICGDALFRVIRAPSVACPPGDAFYARFSPFASAWAMKLNNIKGEDEI